MSLKPKSLLLLKPSLLKPIVQAGKTDPNTGSRCSS